MIKRQKGKNPDILIIEDSLEDFEIVARAFSSTGFTYPIRHFQSGQQALDFLFNGDPESRPGMILLDLNLPGISGIEVLKAIKSHPVLKSVPVIILTTSNNMKDVAECYNEGANSYIIKPIDFHDIVETIKSLETFWFEKSVLPLSCPREGP